jgi:alpha/beta superfamily hydrolase
VRAVRFRAACDGPLLEGVAYLPQGSGPFPTSVVCHPHPLMGGRMDNPIVVIVCESLARRGWAALRFNFRGAGGSEGRFDDGRGEMDDVAGALDFLTAQPGIDPGRLAVVGYSFGAGVGLRHAARDPRLRWMAGIALVQEHYADPFLDDDARPKLFIAGEHDPWAPPDLLRAYVARLRPPKALHVVPHTDHFFGGREGDVATAIASWLAELTPPSRA